MNWSVLNIKKSIIACATVSALVLSGCQPLYSSPDGSIGLNSSALSSISVSQVDTRPAQQVRNHLIFLLSGGSSPINPAYDLKIRVSSTASTVASALSKDGSTGRTAGKVITSVSYELYDIEKKSTSHRGTRTASASYDRSAQSFANERAQRDAENRSAKAAAEQIRLAIAADLSSQ